MAEDKKDFTFDTVAVLCASIIASGGTIGTKTYEMMSALDGKCTANSFQHRFRAVMKRARELNEQQKNGGNFQAVKAAAKRTTKTGAKRGRDTVKRQEEVEGGADDDSEEHESKRVKYDETDSPEVKVEA